MFGRGKSNNKRKAGTRQADREITSTVYAGPEYFQELERASKSNADITQNGLSEDKARVTKSNADIQQTGLPEDKAQQVNHLYPTDYVNSSESGFAAESQSGFAAEQDNGADETLQPYPWSAEYHPDMKFPRTPVMMMVYAGPEEMSGRKREYPVIPGAKSCPVCQAPNNPKAKFCSECVALLRTEESEADK